MGEFRRDASYEERGEKAHVGSRDGRRTVRIEKNECSVDYHVETRQIVNPLNPYEICDSEEDLARALARVVAESKRGQAKEGGK